MVRSCCGWLREAHTEKGTSAKGGQGLGQWHRYSGPSSTFQEALGNPGTAQLFFFTAQLLTASFQQFKSGML